MKKGRDATNVEVFLLWFSVVSTLGTSILGYIVADDFLSHGHAGYNPETVANAYEKFPLFVLISGGLWGTLYCLLKRDIK